MFIREIHSDSSQTLRKKISEAYALFESTPTLPPKLAKKGLANFLGTAISYITGLTTEADLKNLQITMTKLILDSSTTTRYLNHQIKDLSAIFEVTNKRLDHAMSLIHEQNKIFQDFSSTVEKSSGNLN